MNETVGIIGGVGPESTVEYYQYIIAGYRERTSDGGYPSIVVNERLTVTNDWDVKAGARA